MPNVKINDVIYSDISEIQIPLEDDSGNASFLDTSSATATAENIEKGYSAYSNGEKIVGTMESAESPFTTVKIGTYNWGNPEGSAVIIEECVADLSAYAQAWCTEHERQDVSVRVGIAIVADEKPTTTSGIKAIIGAANYTKATDVVNAIAQPISIISGAYYGGVDGFFITNITAIQNTVDNNVSLATNKLTECATCTIYAFDVNF